MDVTPIGLIVIPLSVLIFAFRPQYLIPWAIVVSPFQAASVLNLQGGFPIGISPYFFVCVLIAMQFLPLWMSGKLSFAQDDIALRIIRPLLVLTLWAIASAFILPQLFAGMGVNTPRGGMDSPYTVPLRWTMSNAAQAGYMLLNAIFIISVLWQSNAKSFERAIRLFVASGIIATLIAAYQFAAHYTHLPYPSEFFNSNPAWKQLVDQQVAGVWRLSGTFTEPSVAGAFFAVWSTFLLLIAVEPRVALTWAWPLLLCATGVLLLTASTTGYLIASLVLLVLSFREARELVLNGRVNFKAFGYLLAVFCGIIVAVLYTHDASRLLTKLVLEKDVSASGRDRLTTIFEALRITLDTWGLGAGLGSNRPSGMLFYVISNVGVPGLFIFGYVAYATYSSASDALATASGADRSSAFLVGMCWALAVEMVAMGVAGGDMSGPFLWICWALVAAGTRTVWMRSRSMGPRSAGLCDEPRLGPWALPSAVTGLTYD